ncbi:hypothetical protein HRI_001310400 [Hibiscus trionum]|uniref:WRKY domain-containing protein n=1 Tax=Hibiscus trionum TaxID=183268 RepID=A0A9W7HFE1_HIBTR|nr:hypothetical protein HRI_001310400 [Hibiscus trionum]
MENMRNWEGTLVSELIQGLELAKKLRSSSCVESRDLLVQKILSSYEKALLILEPRGPMEQPQQNVGATTCVAESPLTINGSPWSGDTENDKRDTGDVSKKRKMMPRRDQVRVSSENLLEGPHDDGYSWRKYGQKDILGAKYPRSYYRCTYRNTQNCWATKQVQRSDEDPTIFEVTYRGTHTCGNGNQGVPPPASPEKQERKSNKNGLNNNNYQPLQSQDILLDFRAGLRVDTEGLDNNEMAPSFFPSTSFGCLKNENHSFSPSGVLDYSNILGSFSSPFMSPGTPELSYFSASQMNNFGDVLNTQHSESDLTELVSANTSATNSPIMDLDFSLDHVVLDPNFPFDTPGLFS